MTEFILCTDIPHYLSNSKQELRSHKYTTILKCHSRAKVYLRTFNFYYKNVLRIVFCINASLLLLFRFTRTEISSMKIDDENLSTLLKNIDKLISNVKVHNGNLSFADIITRSVKQVKSLLVKVVDDPSSARDQRSIMLETIKDLQRVEDMLADQEPVIREMEDYCRALVKNNIFQKDRKKVLDVNVVLKYIEELNNPDKIDKIRLKRDIDGIIGVLTEEARHKPELEKLVDYLEVRRSVIQGVIDMGRYMEKWGLTVEDMYKLRNVTLQFAPFIDRELEHKGAVKQMNTVYSSLVGEDFLENPEDAKKMSLMMKLEMLSSMDKVKRKSTRWTRLIEELKFLSNL